MFPIEYETWIDLLLDQFVLSVLISLIFVACTLIVSKMTLYSKERTKMYESTHSDNSNNKEEKEISEDQLISTPSLIRRSQALRAEKIIKANLTEEQQLMEQEVKRMQLAKIHELMLKEREKFGLITMTEVEDQMKLYQCK